jgi:hypothetical protein
MLRRVAIIRIDVSEEHIASVIRVTRIGELGMVAVTTNQGAQHTQNIHENFWSYMESDYIVIIFERKLISQK